MEKSAYHFFLEIIEKKYENSKNSKSKKHTFSDLVDAFLAPLTYKKWNVAT